jgi:hypothetical protein
MRADDNNRIITDEQVSECLRSLPRVDAPGDFEAMVRSRIARGAEVGRGSTGLQALRYAVPVLLVALLAVAGISLLSTDPGEVTGQQATVVNPQASVATVVPPAPAVEPRSITLPPSDDAASGVSGAPVASTSRAGTRAESPSPSQKLPSTRTRFATGTGGGSTDLTGGRKPKTLVVPDVDPTTGNVRQNNGDDFQTSAPLDVRELLQMMGVDGERTENGWKVNSAAAGSAAERSGVKVGDVIESVDDKPLNGKTPLKTVTFGTVQVLRDGKRIKLSIRNK